jgi:hypothetical protein
MGAHGFETQESVILAALTSGDPILLICRSGTGKTFLLNSISDAGPRALPLKRPLDLVRRPWLPLPGRGQVRRSGIRWEGSAVPMTLDLLASAELRYRGTGQALEAAELLLPTMLGDATA